MQGQNSPLEFVPERSDEEIHPISSWNRVLQSRTPTTKIPNVLTTSQQSDPTRYCNLRLTRYDGKTNGHPRMGSESRLFASSAYACKLQCRFFSFRRKNELQTRIWGLTCTTSDRKIFSFLSYANHWRTIYQPNTNQRASLARIIPPQSGVLLDLTNTTADFNNQQLLFSRYPSRE